MGRRNCSHSRFFSDNTQSKCITAERGINLDVEIFLWYEYILLNEVAPFLFLRFEIAVRMDGFSWIDACVNSAHSS